MSETKDMGQEHCIKEADLATLKSEVSDLTKIVKGNGLQKAVTELNLLVPQLSGTVKDLSNNVQTLLDRKVASDTERALKLSAKQKLFAIYGAIVGAATVIVMITDMILKNKVG
ncbi:MAG: hypothetical protein PHW65_05795 [Dehalococcoidales bacterium]|nr:hypothetical protein [Dehalococcoidales bacterium]